MNSAPETQLNDLNLPDDSLLSRYHFSAIWLPGVFYSGITNLDSGNFTSLEPVYLNGISGIKEATANRKIFPWKFRSSSLIYAHNIAVLTPKDFGFSEQELKEMVGLIKPQENKSEIITEDLPGQPYLLSFTVPGKVSQEIINLMPGGQLLSFHNVLIQELRKLNTNVSYKLGALIAGEHLYIALLKNQELQLVNVFSVTNDNDIAYYLLNTRDKMIASGDSHAFVLTGNWTDHHTAIEIIRKYVREVIADSTNTITPFQNILKNQVLCVS